MPKKKRKPPLRKPYVPKNGPFRISFKSCGLFVANDMDYTITPKTTRAKRNSIDPNVRYRVENQAVLYLGLPPKGVRWHWPVDVLIQRDGSIVARADKGHDLREYTCLKRRGEGMSKSEIAALKTALTRAEKERDGWRHRSECEHSALVTADRKIERLKAELDRRGVECERLQGEVKRLDGLLGAMSGIPTTEDAVAREEDRQAMEEARAKDSDTSPADVAAALEDFGYADEAEREEEWLVRSLASARKEVSSWPAWKKEAMRVIAVAKEPKEVDGLWIDTVSSTDQKCVDRTVQKPVNTVAEAQAMVESMKNADNDLRHVDGSKAPVCDKCGGTLDQSGIFREGMPYTLYCQECRHPHHFKKLGSPEREEDFLQIALHPTGQCTCHGEGACDWCIEAAMRENPSRALAEAAAELGHMYEVYGRTVCKELKPFVKKLRIAKRIWWEDLKIDVTEIVRGKETD